MKLRYVGETFGVDSLTNGKIYDASVDDSGDDYLYAKENPAPLDGSSPSGQWEIVEA